MAFFTRVNLNMPVLPPDDAESQIHHKRHSSEPSTVPQSRPITHPSAVNSTMISARIDTKESSKTGTSVQVTSNGTSMCQPISEITDDKSEENGEPKRYEYVVDRVLGVEV